MHIDTKRYSRYIIKFKKVGYYTALVAWKRLKDLHTRMLTGFIYLHSRIKDL